MRSRLTAPAIALALAVAAGVRPAVASPPDPGTAIAREAARALRGFERAQGPPGTVALWPVQVEDGLEDRGGLFPFEVGPDRVQAGRDQRESDVRAVRSLWLAGLGVQLPPATLGDAMARELVRMRAVVDPAAVTEALAAIGAEAAYPLQLSREERGAFVRRTSASRILRTRVALLSRVDAWDAFEDRFLPAGMELRVRVRFELVDIAAGRVVAGSEADLLEPLRYDPAARILDLTFVRTTPGGTVPPRYDVHARVRVSGMTGRVVTVGVCLRADGRPGSSMSLRWGPVDSPVEEFDVSFHDLLEPHGRWRIPRVELTAYVEQAFGIPRVHPPACERKSEDELARKSKRVR